MNFSQKDLMKVGETIGSPCFIETLGSPKVMEQDLFCSISGT